MLAEGVAVIVVKHPLPGSVIKLGNAAHALTSDPPQFERTHT